jgi:hypothetical protein
VQYAVPGEWESQQKHGIRSSVNQCNTERKLAEKSKEDTDPTNPIKRDRRKPGRSSKNRTRKLEKG